MNSTWTLFEDGFGGTAQLGELVRLGVVYDFEQPDTWLCVIDTIGMRRCETGFSSLAVAQSFAETVAREMVYNVLDSIEI